MKEIENLKVVGVFLMVSLMLVAIGFAGIWILYWISQFSEMLAFLLFNVTLLVISCYALAKVMR